MSKNWEDEAENWVKWARTPGHDAYWLFAPEFLDDLIPHPEGMTLEIGCGEGRVARDLRDRGHRVVAADAAKSLVRHAVAKDADSLYLIGAAENLPFPDATFSLVVAYNSLQNVSDLPLSVMEAARVLTPSGHLAMCIAHPFSDAGRFLDERIDAPFVIKNSYFGRRRVDERVERDGLEITFHGWAYPLEDYAVALETAGFLIESIREPLPSDGSLRQQPSFSQWQRIPLFLFLRAVKGAPARG